ncbi:MAG: plasmid pRiA4b ORF-3 family protein [Bacteroidales bacterium]
MNVIYQLKVILTGSSPLIWRRLLVSSMIKLDELHDVIQISMGWEDYHLFQFVSDGVNYQLPDEEDFTWNDETTVNCQGVLLNTLLKKPGDELIYNYDFGDDWQHQIILEKILSPQEVESKIPICVDGENECPPEDCGGIPGYNYMLQVAVDPSHDDYDDIRDILCLEPDEDLNVLKFIDLESINKTLNYIFSH